MNLLLALAQGPADEFWLVTGALLAASPALLAAGLHFLRRGRLYQDTPTSRIRSAAQGYVELEGRARLMPGEPIVAPLSGGRCCWWRIQVDHRDPSDRGRWTTVERELSGALFRLSDDSGDCVVNPDGARVIPSRREVWFGPLPRPPWGPRMGQGLLRRASSRYRYTEERLDIDTPLYAIGLFRTHRGAEAGEDPRLQQRELLLKWKKDARMMALFDVNSDGRVDGDEWESARRLARERVQEKTLQEMPGEDVPVLGSPPDSRPYILSAIPQSQLARREQQRALACLALSVLLSALAGLLLAQRGLL